MTDSDKAPPRGPLEVGERIGDMTILKFRGAGKARQVLLICHYDREKTGAECGNQAWRPYESVRSSRNSLMHMTCKRCGFERNRRKGTIWHRSPKAAE